jgi:hypothetical protein
MTTYTFIRSAIVAAFAVACSLPGSQARADEGALEKFVGRWDVRVKTLQPRKAEMTYIETYEWVLRRQFVSAKTENKSDGTEDIIVAGYDPKAKGYPFWIFSSTGTYLYLPPGSWDPRNRVLEWKNPPQWDVAYHGRCIFPDDNTRRCTLIMKDWKGRVLLEQETSAIRRKQ